MLVQVAAVVAHEFGMDPVAVLAEPDGFKAAIRIAAVTAQARAAEKSRHQS